MRDQEIYAEEIVDSYNRYNPTRCSQNVLELLADNWFEKVKVLS